MIPEAEYQSPDGTLRLLVTVPNGDITIGFAGYTWHTHGDTILGASVVGPEAAARRFIEDLLGGRSIIAVLSAGDVIQDVWVTDDPAGDRKYSHARETLTFRRWDGTKVDI